MAMTASDITGNADLFRRAYPDWPHPAATAPRQPSAIDVGRIATRYVCQMLTAAEALALLANLGCTEDEAWKHLTDWQRPVTEIVDPGTQYLLDRMDA